MDKGSLDLASDILGMIGALALVKPAWRANKIARQRSRVERVQLSPQDDNFLHELRSMTTRQLERDFSSWNRADELCLLIGVVFVIVSFGVKIVWALLYGVH